MSDTVTGHETVDLDPLDPSAARWQASFDTLNLLLQAVGPDNLTADELDQMAAVVAPIYVRKEAAKLKAVAEHEEQIRKQGGGRRLMAVGDLGREVTR